MGRLRETHGPNAGAIYELKDVCVLGRALDCQVHIRDLTVSRRHARICQRDKRFVIEDLGSGNGTFVNSKPVTRCELCDGDTIRVASAIFAFEEIVGNSSSVTMVGPLKSEPQIVKVVDASQSILTDTQALTGSSGAKAHQILASRLRMVYAVSAAISNILDLDELLDKVLEHLFETFPRAERGFIMLLDDETKELIPKAVKRRNEGDIADLEVSRTILQEVIDKRHSVLSHNAMEDKRFRSGSSVANFGIRAMMCAPLVWRGQPLGIAYLDTAGIAAFSQDDLELLTGIAGQSAAALGNARLHEELMKRQRLEQDLRLAEKIQQSFLPRRIPQIDGFTFCARYDPAYQVGGDFYDFINLPEGRIGVVVADVSGKGVAAALYMARLTRDLRYLALAEEDPARVLQWMNRAVLENNQDDLFVTLLYLVLDTQQRRITYANAGHMPLMVRRHSEQDVVQLDGAAGLPLGIVTESDYTTEVFELVPGDSVLLYTDGLVEAMSPTRVMFGMNRLHQALAYGASHAHDILSRLVRACQEHVLDAPQFDDTTLVCFGLDHPDTDAISPVSTQRTRTRRVRILWKDEDEP
ncbi:MAG: SpoIIE family protein phosphatase [Myxococcales bacterium]|nr:SpoIIE family protein phosphatase [Myxococcales bacterium]